MSENALKEQVQARQKGPIVHRRPRISIRRIALHAFGIMVALQAITVAALRVVAIVYRRKRKNDQKPFPHRRFQPVHVDSNELQLYDYGCDLYEDMLAAIDSAKEYIYLETYIWKDDEIGRKFKEHLAKKAAEGVEVYVVFDWFGNLVVPRAFKSFPSSIHKMAYHPIKHPWQLFDPRRYALDHRKMLSVDGKIGFIGGFNLGSLYATRSEEHTSELQS